MSAPRFSQSIPGAAIYTTKQIADVKRISLGEQCDRVLYFFGRTSGDYAYAMFAFPLVLAMPELLGEVDDETMTHGFVGSPTRQFKWLAVLALRRHSP